MSRRLKPPPRKASLSFQEQIIAAHLYYVRGLEQQDIALALNVNNIGRVNEACVAVRRALRDKKEEAPDDSSSERTDEAASDFGGRLASDTADQHPPRNKGGPIAA